MKIIKLKKGDENMEHKDLWLVIGLTVILAVAVSVSTVSLTGDALFGYKLNTITPKAPVTTPPTATYSGFKSLPANLPLTSCIYVGPYSQNVIFKEGASTNDVCAYYGYSAAVAYDAESSNAHYSSNDGSCSGKVISYDTRTVTWGLTKFGAVANIALFKTFYNQQCVKSPNTNDWRVIGDNNVGVWCCK